MTTETHHKGRWMALMLAVAVAAGLLALALSTARTADAAQFKTVTKTFGKPGLIEIPAGFGSQVGPSTPYPSARFIGSLGFPAGAKVVDVNLKFRDFGHASPDDVDMMLLHRSVNRIVFSDVGGLTNVTDLTLTLDDQAQATPPDDPLTSGTFKPFNDGGLDTFPAPAPTPQVGSRLEGFDGLNPEGQWKLFINDDAGQDAGSLGNGWSLQIKARYPTS